MLDGRTMSCYLEREMLINNNKVERTGRFITLLDWSIHNRVLVDSGTIYNREKPPRVGVHETSSKRVNGNFRSRRYYKCCKFLYTTCHLVLFTKPS